MATKADVDRLRLANARIAQLAKADMRSLFGSLNPDRPEVARDALLETVPALADRYGTVSAIMAAEWFDELYAASGRRQRFRAQPAATVQPAAVQGTVKWAVGGLFDGKLDTLGLLVGAMSKWALQPGRDTVATNAARSSARWGRVPSGAKTCAFCLMMASRGFVYHTEQTAGGGNDYHGDCDCVPTPDWSEDPHVEGYDPEALYRVYDQAADEVGNRFNTHAILSALRSQQGIS